MYSIKYYFMHVVLFLSCSALGVTRADTFWQVSDLHWDRMYSRTGDPLSNCHGVNVTVDNGDYGNIECDTNTKLYESAIQAMFKIEPEAHFILWTGDNAPHIEYPNQTWIDVYETLANASSLLKHYFPTTEIFPVLGNHDTVPAGQFPANDTQFYENFLTNGNWSDFIGDCDTRETFLRGGYYSKAVAAGLRVMVLNTCLYLRENRLVNETDDDPGGQFAWIQQELEVARRRQENVIITSHVAPGYYATSAITLHMKTEFNDRLVHLMADQSDVLVALVFGHEHLDSFRLISDVEGNFKVAAFIAPPVNPWIPDFLLGKGSVNPGIRLYVYNNKNNNNNNYNNNTSQKVLVEDYHQFYLNYQEANHNASVGDKCDDDDYDRLGDVPSKVCICNDGDCAEWRLLYRPTVEYNLTDLSLDSVVHLYDKLKYSRELFDVFAKHIHLDYVVAPCDYQCRHDVFCSFVSITEEAMKECLAIERHF